MKKTIAFLVCIVLIAMGLLAQSPLAFKYQAVARDNAGNVIADQNVSFSISILIGSTTGYAVYVETQNAVTNQFGLVNLEIGSGTVVSGIFANINWQTGLFFLKLEMDAAGGTDYQLMGISQLLSVPFALEAKHASSITLTDENGNTYQVGVDTLGNLITTPVYQWQTCGDELTDIRDGQKYGTVLIGDQCWLSENLNIGNRIAGIQDQTNNSIIEKYCYDNAETNCDVYGGLYQWDEMMQYSISEIAQGICPGGWRIPKDLEWKVLEGKVDGQYGIGDPEWDKLTFRGYDAGGNLKEEGTTHWNSPNTGATNQSNFTALPSGARYYDGSSFIAIGNYGTFWSSTFEPEYGIAITRQLFTGNANVGREYIVPSVGFSVRCLKDYTNQPPSAPSDPVPSHGATNVSIDQDLSWSCSDPDGNNLYYKVYFGANPTPPFIAAGLTAATYDPGTLNYNTTYYWMITAFDSYGDSAVSNVWSFTTLLEPVWACGDVLVDARDSQSYSTVQIGTQCWMAENLNIGTMIPGATAMANNSIIEKYCYNNSTANCDVYGGLYQWNEMMQYSTTPGVQGICPADWHLPTDAEWTVITTFLGGEVVAGGKMKATGTIEAGTGLWYATNTGATNESGFTALPGGKSYNDGDFYGLGYETYFWSSTEVVTNAWFRFLYHYDTHASRSHHNKTNGNSVRCLQD